MNNSQFDISDAIAVVRNRVDRVADSASGAFDARGMRVVSPAQRRGVYEDIAAATEALIWLRLLVADLPGLRHDDPYWTRP